MKKEVFGSCPVCDSELKVTRLYCNSCGTNIKSEFELFYGIIWNNRTFNIDWNTNTPYY